MSQGDGLKDDGKPSSDMKSLSFVFNTENIKRMVPSVCGDHTMGKLDDTQKALYMPVVEETPEETTTTPVEETTTVPTDDVTTTSPADDVTTTAPADETTAPADETTTAIPENTTKAPENTTKAPEEPSKKSCGGFALAAQLVTILGAAVTVVIVKKK